MSLSPTDKREFCSVHGWVGRSAYQRDRHDLCEDPDAAVVEESSNEEDVVEDEPEVEKPSRSPRRRRPGVPNPKKTVAVRRITRLELAAGQAELVTLGVDGPYWRPRIRADCAKVPRPCPYVGCRYSMYLDVAETGSIIFNFPHLTPEQMPVDRSCALDLAERGGMTLEQVGVAQALTRERVRQVEVKALVKLFVKLTERGVSREDVTAIALRYVTGPGGELADKGADGELPSDVAALLFSSTPTPENE